MSHAGFLHAIRETPDDDAPRLIYADWLDDHDQPERAEFIRLQCRLAGLDEYAPERPALLRREYELFADHGADWAARLAGRVLSWRFRRGFIERVKATVPQFLQAADWLLDFAPVRELSLASAYRADDLRPLVESPHALRLERLQADHHHIGDDGVRLLAASPHLANLTHLSLQGAWFTRDGLLALGSSPWLRGLRSLDVEQNPALDSAAFAAFVTACDLPRLAQLGWTGDIGLDAFRALLAGPLAARLTELRVSEAALGADGVRLLCATDALAGLRELSLYRRRDPVLSPAELGRRLAESPLLARLHTLTLPSSMLADEGAAALARAPAGALRRLHLAQGGIGPAGAIALADSALCSTLAHLDLSHNPIEARGLAALLAAPRLRNLRSLDVSNLGTVPRRAVVNLLASTDINRLAHLNLAWCKIEDQALAALRLRLGERLGHERNAVYAREGEFLARLAARPPRFLRGLRPRADTELTRRFQIANREMDVGVTFELTPPDPAQRPVLLGYEASNLFVSPYALRWEPSGVQREFYDAEQHGNYAEGGYNDTIVGRGDRTEWSCGRAGCREHTFLATVAYRYGERVGDAPELPFCDQFFYFHLDAYCAAQDQLLRIASFADK